MVVQLHRLTVGVLRGDAIQMPRQRRFKSITLLVERCNVRQRPLEFSLSQQMSQKTFPDQKTRFSLQSIPQQCFFHIIRNRVTKVCLTVEHINTCTTSVDMKIHINNIALRFHIDNDFFTMNLQNNPYVALPFFLFFQNPPRYQKVRISDTAERVLQHQLRLLYIR